jgi:hypothetical protein
MFASFMGAAFMQPKYEITIVRKRMVITLLTWWNCRGENRERDAKLVRAFFHRDTMWPI